MTPPTATSGAHGLAARAMTEFGLFVVTTGSRGKGFCGMGTTSGLPRPCAIDTGLISLLKKPSLAARAYFCCEPSANLSQSSRLS